MNDFLVARMNLRGLHPRVLLEACRNREVDVLVGALRRKRILLLHRQNDIGLSDFPTVNQIGSRRQILRVSFFRALIYPRGNCIDVTLTQARIIGELSIVRIGGPRRHLPANYSLAD